MTKTLHILLVGTLLALTACHPVTVDFSYSPTAPKTGEKVVFTNLSANGEKYAWDFGDNRSDSTKGASHIYKKAGTYMVTLTETRSHKQCQHAVIVTDSLPGIGWSRDSVLRYDTVTVYAQVWNPYNHAIGYQWLLDDQTVLVDGQLTDPSIVVLFTTDVPDGQSYGHADIRLQVTMDGATTTTTATPAVYPSPAPCVLFRTPAGDFFQRLYLPRYEAPHAVKTNTMTALLNAAVPATQQVDSVEQKRYTASANGLYIENTNHTHSVQLTTDSVGVLAISLERQLLVYSTASGMYLMPLIHALNNQTAVTPVRINTLNGVQTVVIPAENY